LPVGEQDGRRPTSAASRSAYFWRGASQERPSYSWIRVFGANPQRHHRSPGFADDAIVIAAAPSLEPRLRRQEVSSNPDDDQDNQTKTGKQQYRLGEAHARSLAVGTAPVKLPLNRFLPGLPVCAAPTVPYIQNYGEAMARYTTSQATPPASTGRPGPPTRRRRLMTICMRCLHGELCAFATFLGRKANCDLAQTSGTD
jgi:hypothetical protein